MLIKKSCEAGKVTILLFEIQHTESHKSLTLFSLQIDKFYKTFKSFIWLYRVELLREEGDRLIEKERERERERERDREMERESERERETEGVVGNG